MSLNAPKPNLGVLRLTATNEPLDYRAFELSSCSIGIIADQQLSSRDYLVLENAAQRIPLRVMDAKLKESQHGDNRYRLVCLDSNLQLDQVCLRWQGAGKTHFQYARFSLNPKLYVELKHLVTHATQLLESVNISRTGILLKTQSPQSGIKDFPINSQAWVRLDIARLWLPQILEPRAQVVRAYLDRVDGQTFGFFAIQFQGMQGAEATLWNELISRLERSEIPGSECVRPAFDPRK